MPKRKFSHLPQQNKHRSGAKRSLPTSVGAGKELKNLPKGVSAIAEASDRGTDVDDGYENVNASRLLLSTFGHVEKYESAHSDEPGESGTDEEDGQQNLPRQSVESTSDTESVEEDIMTQDANLDILEAASNSDADNEMRTPDEPGDSSNVIDPFVRHFETLIPEDLAESAKVRAGFVEEEFSLPVSGTVVSRSRADAEDQKFASRGIQNSHVRENLVRNVGSLSSRWKRASSEYFAIMNSYRDLFHFHKDHQLDNDLKRAYSLHIVNHILKTRNRVISHNTKLSKRVSDSADSPQFRDQGYCRPKTLILLPFRHNAYKIFEILCDLLNTKEDIQVMNRKRFVDEFGWKDKDPVANSDRPEDFRADFTGNTDDCFRIGIAIAKKTLKLYTEFYSADIIIASPLGLRMIIGNEGEKQYEYDFLSSIEIFVMDQADVFLMQNWEHVMHILKHMHRIPSSTKDIDFARVRPWVLNGWSQIYRQTILLSAFRSPELQSVANRYCSNYSGSVTFKFPSKTTALASVIVPVPHSFEKIAGSDIQKSSDARFRYFCDKVMPGTTDANRSHTMIFIPSYFDFVRVRNHFKREETSFVQICEYTSPAKVTRARDLFFHGKKQIMLYTERFHFYRRYRIRGIRHIIFYGAPHYPQFYSELCNMTMVEEEGKLKESSVTCLFSRFDLFRLVPVIGVEKANLMVQSEKSVHVFVTEPEEQASTKV